MLWSLVIAASAQEPAPLAPIAVDRRWGILTDPGGDLRAATERAGEALGDWTIELSGVPLDGPTLIRIAQTAPDEPWERVLREQLRRPVDALDLLYFLDDVLVAGEAGRRGEPFHVTTGRARTAGILLHPDDVWEGKPRVYPKGKTLAVDEPAEQEDYPPAADGDLPGPEWTMRYRSPTTRDEMFATLAAKRPQSTFCSRVAGLITQLEQQGAEVWMTSFLRYRERGYLMWGAFELRRTTSASGVASVLKKLDEANEEWAHVPITWSSPDGWQDTRERARRMADAFDVVYATPWGARHSNHYDGTAVDFSVVGLPRTLVLLAPDGERRVFDLSDPSESRDLSLTPEVVRWVEKHFRLDKLEDDHPHWDDPETPDVPK
ncbi:MAG: hypothetical protein H6738_07365 [Alphaproteobacteria bacterium]|nr:hypothetical protein [Alphaproteobacteria bacterium]MCB9696582.1 hypothetical protein [Alphaproteobacteria bacterium]